MAETTDTRDHHREQIIEVAAALLAQGGPAAVTTRGVADGAGVQAPTIYRLFGDKEGLLDAVAEHAMEDFAAAKAAAVDADAARLDPLRDLRQGWDMTVEFGLTNPELYRLLLDPARGRQSPAAQAGIRLLAERVHRVALTGRLAVAEEHAVEVIQAAGTGAVLTTLARPVTRRDRSLADTMFDAVLQQILTSVEDAGPDTVDQAVADQALAHAVALRAHTGQLSTLSAGERLLMTEWLDRIIEEPGPRTPRLVS
jgi:AcrR family transcriptional regulator